MGDVPDEEWRLEDENPEMPTPAEMSAPAARPPPPAGHAPLRRQSTQNHDNVSPVLPEEPVSCFTWCWGPLFVRPALPESESEFDEAESSLVSFDDLTRASNPQRSKYRF